MLSRLYMAWADCVPIYESELVIHPFMAALSGFLSVVKNRLGWILPPWKWLFILSTLPLLCLLFFLGGGSSGSLPALVQSVDDLQSWEICTSLLFSINCEYRCQRKSSDPRPEVPKLDWPPRVPCQYKCPSGLRLTGRDLGTCLLWLSPHCQQLMTGWEKQGILLLLLLPGSSPVVGTALVSAQWQKGCSLVGQGLGAYVHFYTSVLHDYKICIEHVTMS